MENKRILVIDDDDFVRTVVCKGLRTRGYRVLEAANGELGMSLIERGENPDLVITDIVMPEKDGLETILELRKKCPGIKVIAISGAGYGWGGDYLTMSHKLVRMPFFKAGQYGGTGKNHHPVIGHHSFRHAKRLWREPPDRGIADKNTFVSSPRASIISFIFLGRMAPINSLANIKKFSTAAFVFLVIAIRL